MADDTNIFDKDLGRGPANFRPLTPLSFLARNALVYPEKTAVVHGDRRIGWRALAERCRRLASALRARGIGRGDTVAVLAPNTPAMLEAHYGVPMAGAVLNAINTRLDPRSIAFILNHGEAEAFLVDIEWAKVARDALAAVDRDILVVDIEDALALGSERVGRTTYESLLAEGDPAFVSDEPGDEWQAISLCYTSGTTGDPKGAVYHHRGAYLNALGNAMVQGMDAQAVYLWTLPMFHCNGWSCTWGVSAAAGTHVCLRRVEPAAVFEAILRERVTHLCAAPIVLNMLAHAPENVRRSFDWTVRASTGGAAPPSSVIAAMERMGFTVTHLYGLTESYGPATVCAWQDGWDGLPPDERALRMARQGVRYPTLEDVMVADPVSACPVPADGTTLGEIMLRGNTVMKGYLKNPKATAAAFTDGWYHTGDLAVLHPDGYVEIKDRAKDVIISGGENISSLEVEEVLYRHPAVMEAAVVARPDPVWGESPCAFVTLDPHAEAIDEPALLLWCRDHLAGFKCPRKIVFGPLPKTATGKIQKFTLRERAKALAG